MIDITRYGSHKDIFPTLFNLSLSNTEYFKSGNNLFGSESNDYFALNDYNRAFNKNGCVLLKDNPIYFKWNDKKLISCTAVENPGIEKLLKHAKTYSTFLELYIQNQIITRKK
jgi:phosphoglycerol transferase MdoB-like AlkP superfamily enzyme